MYSGGRVPSMVVTERLELVATLMQNAFFHHDIESSFS